MVKLFLPLGTWTVILSLSAVLLITIAEGTSRDYDCSFHKWVLAHAFSPGKPAVVTDAGGLRAEVEASGGGVVVPLGDLEQLKEYIVVLLANRQIRQRYAQRALAYVEKRIGWTWQGCTNRFICR